MNPSPVFESLEQRQMLSGTVLATIHGSTLTIQGDAADNTVVVTRSGNSLTVTPNGTTAVNAGLAGVAAVLDVTGVTRVKVRMGDGNDSVMFSGQAINGVTTAQSMGELDAAMGDGNDTLILNAVAVGGKAVIGGGRGSNTVTLTGLDPADAPAGVATTVGGPLTINGCGRSADTVNLIGVSVAGKTKVASGSGAANITIDGFVGGTTSLGNLFSGGVTINLAGGSDSVTVDGAVGATTSVVGDLNVLLGGGTDSLTVMTDAGLSVTGALNVTGHTGAKTVSLTDAIADGGFGIATGRGNDSITLTGIESNAGARVNTGAGNDGLTFAGGVDLDGDIYARFLGSTATLNVANTSADSLLAIARRGGTNTRVVGAGVVLGTPGVYRNFP